MPRPPASLTAPATRDKPQLPAERAQDKRVKPRIRKAIAAMVFEGLTRKQAAETVGITDQTLAKHFHSPHVVREYQRQLQVLRESERAKNVHVGIEIRDSAAPPKARIDAMKFIEGHHDKQGVTVHVGVGVQVQPGYIVDVSEHSEKARQILHLSGSRRNVQEDQ